MFTGFRKFLMELQGGKPSKDAERSSATSSPDPVIQKKNDAKSQATPAKEQVQTNALLTAVLAASTSETTSEAAVHEESQALQEKGQPNKVQTELHLPPAGPDQFPNYVTGPAGTDQFPNYVTGPDASRRQGNNIDGVIPPQHNFYQPEHNVHLHDDSWATRDSSSNRRVDQHYPYPHDQGPPRAHGDQYHGQDQYWPRNDHHIIGGGRYPHMHGDGPAEGIQNREKRSSSSGDEQSGGTLVYDNIVICEDPSKVVIGKRNSAGGKFGGRISGNRVIR